MPVRGKMMAVDNARAKSLFLAASDLPDLAARIAYLDRECGGDLPLRNRVEALLRAGFDAYLVKPASNQQILDTIASLQSGAMKLTFWGTRGSIPRPGPKTLKYGGNTSCVSIEMTRDRLFIFDAGTGIIDLGR